MISIVSVVITAMFAVGSVDSIGYPSASGQICECVCKDKKSDLEDAIGEALRYIKKALNSSSIDDLHYYARKSKNYASDAEDLADDLDLDDIEYYCSREYRYCRTAEGGVLFQGIRRISPDSEEGSKQRLRRALIGES